MPGKVAVKGGACAIASATPKAPLTVTLHGDRMPRREEDGGPGLAASSGAHGSATGAAGTAGAWSAAGRRDRRHAWCRERRSLPPRRSRALLTLGLVASDLAQPSGVARRDSLEDQLATAAPAEARRRRALEYVEKVVTASTTLVVDKAVPSRRAWSASLASGVSARRSSTTDDHEFHLMLYTLLVTPRNPGD